EVEALGFAVAHGLLAPEVLAADVAGDEVGDGVPAVVMAMVPGRPLAEPDLTRLAQAAAAIHDVDARSLGHEYFRWYAPSSLEVPANAVQPAVWAAAIARCRDDPPDYSASFIHRDFHPGNVLWTRGRVAGVVDWVNACRGPWGCDIAHCRSNLAGPGD